MKKLFTKKEKLTQLEILKLLTENLSPKISRVLKKYSKVLPVKSKEPKKIKNFKMNKLAWRKLKKVLKKVSSSKMEFGTLRKLNSLTTDIS
jgi:hypothetical protein